MCYSIFEGGAGDEVLSATLYARGVGERVIFDRGTEVFDALVMAAWRLCVLLLLSMLDALEAMCCVLALYAGGGGGLSSVRRRCWKYWKCWTRHAVVLEALEVIRNML